MIIKIASDNPNLSYILSKNPASGLFIKPIRAGFALGKYISDTTYVLAYEEAKDSDSFEKEDSYLHYQKYCNPSAALNLLRTLSCVTQDSYKQYETEPFRNSINIPCICLNNLPSTVLQTKGVEVDVQPIDNTNLCTLTIYTDGSLIDTLRYLAIIIFLSTLKQDQYYTWDQVSVYMTLISKLPFVPFSVRHRFRGILKHNFVHDAVKLLNTESTTLSPIGNMEEQRKAFVSNHVKYRTVLDIGCNIGKYIKPSKATKYIGVDILESALHKAQLKAQDYGIEHSFFTHYKEALESLTEDTTVLLIEVIEHIEYNEMLELLQLVKANEYVKQLLLSTPNKDFNQYLGIQEGEVRYFDHLFELTEEEFVSILGKPLQWGDRHQGHCMTLYINQELNP